MIFDVYKYKLVYAHARGVESVSCLTTTTCGSHIGVRSGMASKEQNMEVDGDSSSMRDTAVPTDSRELIQTVRMSLQPPPRFAEGTDLVLWLKRFEMYVRKIEVDENQWSSELLPLLEDGPFRVCRSRDWSTQVTTWL